VFSFSSKFIPSTTSIIHYASIIYLSSIYHLDVKEDQQQAERGGAIEGRGKERKMM